jgi:signal peptidase I
VDVGDLVVGARSGSGEPEKGDVAVPQVPPADDVTGGAGPAPGYAPNGGHPGGDGLPVNGGLPVTGGFPANGSGSANGSSPAHGPRQASGPSDVSEAPGTQDGTTAYGVPGAADEPAGHGLSGAKGDARPDDGPGPGDPPGPSGGDGSGDGSGDGGSADRPGSSRRAKPQRSFWKELPLLIGIALVLALLIKTFLVQAFSIPSDSMQNTLLQGDRVLVDKLTPWFGSDPSRGEVVVFHDPGGWLPENPPASSNPVVRAMQKSLSFIGLMPSADEKDLIKRVIGVGGDTVECKGTGPVLVNGKPLDEPYVHPGSTPCSKDAPFKVVVPKGRIWVMGDNRQNSLDSRYHMQLPGGGTVSDKDVVGRAIVVAWPVNRWATLDIPGTFSQPGIDAAGAAAPAAAGLAGAVPLVLLRRRRLMSRLGDPAGDNAETEG